MTLYLLQYNNYYNRISKKFDTINEYDSYMIGVPVYRVNFDPADGIATEQIINWSPQYPNPDYAIVTDDDNTIVSRWFVMEQTRTRSGQYRIILRRDVIADNYNDVINAPVFIEKARLATSNPLIHNSENMTYNQILQNKYELTDDTRIPWVVGYVPRDFKPTAGEPIPVVAQSDSSVDIVVNSILDWNYYRYTNLGSNKMFHPYPENPYLTVRFSQPYSDPNYFRAEFNVSAFMNQDTNYTVYSADIPASSGEFYPLIAPDVTGSKAYITITAQDMTNITRSLFNNLRTVANWDSFKATLVRYHNIGSESETANFRALNNKRILDSSTGIIYDISVVEGNISNQLKQDDVNIYSNTGIDIKNLFRNNTNFATYNFDSTTFGWSTDEAPLTLKLSTIGVNLSIRPTAERYQLEDSPYDMFAIPAGSIDYHNGLTRQTLRPTIESACAVATAIGAKLGTGAIYDIQLLPYCPVRYAITQVNEINATGHPVWPIVDSDNNTVNVILWATKSSDKFSISKTISVPSNPTDYKVANECDFNRLVSPNGAGMFEFKPTTNGGVRRIEVDFTYKPFSPFIHLRPNFGNLYGKNYDKDFRGLICGGDFSIPQLSNAWANYQQNNVNYQNIFNRQIENMEVNNAVQKEKEAWSVATSALGAGLGAGMGAGIAGAGPWGIAVGAAAAGASALAGMKDIKLNERLRQEALDYTKDQFGYQLGNIKAIPTALAKTGALLYNNTIFPTLEYYSCTEVEKEALRDKLRYNGMTVMATGTILQHMWEDLTYIKGKLIRCESLADDYHVLAEIARELDKGVFI